MSGKDDWRRKMERGESFELIPGVNDVEHYLDSDDDEESPLGAAIFRDMFGFTVEEVLDSEDEEED